MAGQTRRPERQKSNPVSSSTCFTVVTNVLTGSCRRRCPAPKKSLAEWIDSSYCRTRGITKDTVAEVMKRAWRRESLLGRSAR
jgi:hypothetical protein